jgi:hypothetical protein
VARYIERGPVSLEKLSVDDDIITYTTKESFYEMKVEKIR